MARSRPLVILSAAVSVDGKIASKSGDSALSSGADLRRLHRLRSQVDAVLVGKNTVLQDDPLLTVRNVRGKNPVRIVLDSNGEIPKGSQILQTSKDVRTIVAVSRQIPETNLQKLERFPIEVVYSGTGRVNLESLLKKLYKRGIGRLLVEGGGTVNWEFVKCGLFDEMIVTVSPRLLGGASPSLVGGAGFAKISDSPRLSLRSSRRLKDHVVLHYVRR